MSKVNEKILLTGGAGFLGSHICSYAIKQGFDVVIVDIMNSETTTQEEKKSNLEYLRSESKKYAVDLKIYIDSITDKEALRKIFVNELPTTIIHAASLVKDRYSMVVPHDFIETNVLGTQITLECAQFIDTVEQFIFISSRSAVGEVPGAESFISENNHFRPINPYGATKAAAESLCHSFHHNNKIPLKICRMQPMYGPRCRPDMFVWRLLYSMKSGETVQKYGTGEGVRDWLFIDDAAEAIFKVKNHNSELDIFNIGTGIGTSTNSLIALCEEITGIAAIIEHVDAPPGDAHFAGLADCSKIKAYTGWSSKVDIQSGIRRTYDYMRDSYSGAVNNSQLIESYTVKNKDIKSMI